LQKGKTEKGKGWNGGQRPRREHEIPAAKINGGCFSLKPKKKREEIEKKKINGD